MIPPAKQQKPEPSLATGTGTGTALVQAIDINASRKFHRLLLAGQVEDAIKHAESVGVTHIDMSRNYLISAPPTTSDEFWADPLPTIDMFARVSCRNLCDVYQLIGAMRAPISQAVGDNSLLHAICSTLCTLHMSGRFPPPLEVGGWIACVSHGQTRTRCD